MGCSSAKEKIEKKISILKNEKSEIQKERENYLKKLELIEGCRVTRTPIPDFINKENKNIVINKYNKNNIENEIIVKQNKHHHHHHHLYHHHYQKN